MSDSLIEIERVFLALSDKTRIRLVGLMCDGEVSVNYLCESIGESQPKVSRHLAYLRSMGMVNTRREGKWIYYSLSEPENRFGARLLRDTLNWIGSISREGASTSPPQSYEANTSENFNTAAEENIYVYTDVTDDSDELEVYLL